MLYPDWLKVKAVSLEQQNLIVQTLRDLNINTVCESARCPNIGECFAKNTATFLILGNICTRNCAFCAVSKGVPVAPDPLEPINLAEAVRLLKLKHVVITSVTRDDLPDGGSSYFAQCVDKVKNLSSGITVELLIPDFMGSIADLRTVIDSEPDVLNHNIETVPRLYPEIRARADYKQSLNILQRTKEINTDMVVKSGIMLGLGEDDDEVLSTIREIRNTGCDVLTIGQYLSPGPRYRPVSRFVEPERFEWFGAASTEMGFGHVFSAPLVRSSYRAKDVLSYSLISQTKLLT